MNKNLLVQYLNCRRLPMSQVEGATHLHQALCEVAPDFYLHLLTDPVSEVSHKQTVLANVLTSSTTRHIPRQHILNLLRTLPTVAGLQVVDEIRRFRINRRRAQELGLAFLIGHEQFSELAATRKQRVSHLLKHLLGERTWSAVCRSLRDSTSEGERATLQRLLHYAPDTRREAAREVLCFLAGAPMIPHDPYLKQALAARQNIDKGAGLPRETLFGLRGVFHTSVPAGKVRALSAIDTQSTRKDGPLTALYKEVLFEQPLERHSQELSTRLAHAVETIPTIEGRLAIVLDLSGSAASSGERAQHPAALGLALTRILQARVRAVSLHQVGGTSETFPVPQGATDLASAIIEAAREKPQVMLVITDGYENARQGDAAEVIRGIRQLGLEIPIYQVVPIFASAEDLSQRRLGELAATLPIEHEDGVHELIVRILLASADDSVSPTQMALIEQLLFVP